MHNSILCVFMSFGVCATSNACEKSLLLSIKISPSGQNDSNLQNNNNILAEH